MLNFKSLRTEWVTLLASLYLLIGFNMFLWEHLQAVVPPGLSGLWLILAFAVLMLFAFNLVLTLFAFRYVLKPLLVVLFISGAGVAYFMNQYGVLIDAGMFRNMAETNVAEVRDLMSFKFAAYILLLGVLPSVLVCKAQIAYRRWQRELLGKLLVSGACVVALGSVALVNYQGLSSLLRNHHELRLMLTPSNVVGASIGYVGERVGTAARPFQPYGQDAKRDVAWQKHERKSLTVLVVGESARADHFGVLGYGRDTTPNLAKEQGLLAFSDVHSCGTETAVSVPCMFSGMQRKDYDASVANRLIRLRKDAVEKTAQTIKEALQRFEIAE
jgi:lipid A ethanolaminephosphotransferase